MTDPASDKDVPPAAPDATGEATPAAPRRGLFRKRTPAPPATVDEAPSDREVVAELSAEDVAAADTDGAQGHARRPGVLRRRRRKLLGQYEQGIFDLGGLALELHRRGLLAEDVMRRKAAEVTDLRGQVDRLDEQLEGIRSDRAERRQSGRGATRTCPSCGARVKASAKFCSECGAPLAAADGDVGASAAAEGGGDQPTQVIAGADAQATQVIVEPDTQATQVISDAPQETAVLPPVKVDE